MSSRRPSPSAPHRRVIALKRPDGVPLTRVDIQYDVLYNIFHDLHAVFTDPFPVKNSDTLAPKLTFRDLYLKTILHASKATKALKDKMADSQMFSEDFAMLALLVNVGRVNTTMSFFPEMKTTIRSYHPIPSLQRTTGNLQDAPRIKHLLKSSALETEQGKTPSTPTDILSRAKSGRVPSTTVMNLIFVLANHSVPIGHLHLSDKSNFLDLFIHEGISSYSRARAFLWLCYHYLELPTVDNDDGSSSLANPFADDGSVNPPNLVFLPEGEIIQENVDPEDEKELAEKLISQRAEILQTQGNNKRSKANAMTSTVSDTEAVGAHSNGQRKKRNIGTLGDENLAANGRKQSALKDFVSTSREESGDEDTSISEAFGNPRHIREDRKHHPQNRRMPSSTPEPSDLLGRLRGRFSPYPSSNSYHNTRSAPQKYNMTAHPRSMLQQAWHVVTTTDPLVDSDDEAGDEYLRRDYIQRLKVINSLR